MAARYTVVQTDPRTGAIIAELPVTGISYTHTLNADGSASVGVPMSAPEADPSTLIPGMSGLAILRDGLPVWGGFVWTASADIAAGVLTLNAAGYHSYYRGRVLDMGYTGYSGMDEQASMVRSWITTANADNGINTETGLIGNTGKIKRRTWSRSELKNIAEAIEELANEFDGFTFRYEPYRSTSGGIRNRIRIFPKVVPKNFNLRHLNNCEIAQVSYDSSAMATRVFALGADNGNGTKLLGLADNLALSAAMPTKVIVSTFGDEKATQALRMKAAAIAAAGHKPIAIPSVTLYPGTSPLDFMPGFSGTVQADAGYVQLLDEYVVTETKTTVDANGTEVVALALADKDLFEHVSSN